MTEVKVGKGPPRGSVLLGKYEVESTLGFGGMGLVIKAKHLAVDEHVAIKLLREDVQIDEENVTRFVREAKNAVKLKSEHVARIRDVGKLEDGRPYMVMELLDGLDLGKTLLDHGSIERSRAVDLVLQACDAIAEAHSLGIVHRDIKPTNLFVAKRRDGTDLLKVLDFGISKATLGPDLSLTQTQSMLGTPAYMSPEQMRSARTVDPRSDIWSLGCVLYELVEGHAPFDASNFAELCVMVTLEPFTPLVTAPELTPVIARVLAKNPGDRYQDIAELAYALEPFASDPERARRQVARVFRVLGRSHPNRPDSTPLPLERGSTPRLGSQPIERGSAPRIGSQPSYPALPQTPRPTVVIDKAGRWKGFALLGLLAGAGLAGGMWFGGAGKELPSPSSGSLAPPAGSSTVQELTVDRADAAIEIVEAIDAGVTGADPGGDSGSAAVVATDVAAAQPATRKPTPPRKVTKAVPKPPKQTAAKPTPPKPTTTPPKQPATTTTTPPTPPKPPKPKCDPFDNPNGCD